MRKILTVIFIMSMLLNVMPFTGYALTEGNWEYEILENEITITGYIGNDVDIVIPDKIRELPVTVLDFAGGNDRYETSLKQAKTIKLPETVHTIGEAAFLGADVLKINFPEKLQYIGKRAFEKSSIQNLDFSNKNVIIDECAFNSCDNLKSVVLPSNMISIPYGCFGGSEKLEEVVIPNGVEVIEKSAFYNCSSIKHIILPKSLKKIHEGAFSKCSSLESVVIPYGTTYLGKEVVFGKDMPTVDLVFDECSSLKAVYIPNTVTSFGEDLVSQSNNAIIYCSANSYVADKCKQYGISHITDESVNSPITVYYNMQRISFGNYGQNPTIIDGRTLVPLRSIFEAMGATVNWDNNNQTATGTKNGITIKVKIGSSTITKNGKDIATDVPAQIINDRTMVPARVIAEAFDAKVSWDDNSQSVMITE